MCPVRVVTYVLGRSKQCQRFTGIARSLGNSRSFLSALCPVRRHVSRQYESQSGGLAGDSHRHGSIYLTRMLRKVDFQLCIPMRGTKVPCSADLLHEFKHDPGKLLKRSADGIIYNEHEAGAIGPRLFEQACKMGLEGIVSKRRHRGYKAGPCKDWIKVKNPKSAAMVRAKEGEW